MAAEFRASFDEMARQSELDELRKEVEAMRQGQLLDIATHAPEVNQTFDEISQGLSDVGVQLNTPANYPYAPAHVEAAPNPKPRTRKAAAKKAPAKAAAAKKPVAPKTTAKPKVSPKPKAAKAPAKPASARPGSAKPASAKPRTRKAAAP
jgi:sec-independent protein translocase protein TatB